MAALREEWDEAVRQLLAGNSARMMNLIDDYDSELLSTVDDLKDRKVEGKTAIYAAVRSGDRECVEQLLELDVNVTYEVSASTEDEDLGDKVAVKTRYGSPSSKFDAKGSQNLTAWLFASDGMAQMKESANKPKALAPVHLACLLDHSEILQLLIDHLNMMDRQTACAELDRPTDNTQRTRRRRR